MSDIIPCSKRRRQKQRAAALITVLAAMVLVSALVLAFYVQASLNRQISFSSVGQYRADAIGKAAMDTIAGDLLAEIIAGSTNPPNNTNVFLPVTNFAVVPSRVADQGFPNLVKKSASLSNSWQGSFYSTPGLVRSAADNSTTNVSANGRRVDTNRWNAHYLFGETLPAAFTSPDWILVTRSGVTTNAAALPAMSVLAESSPENTQYVVGRFAYAIYDEGGLLDITVAGHPDNVSQDFSAQRGLQPQIDLGKIPGVSDANSLIKWRNSATAASPGSYTNYVLSNTNGFTSVAPGDQTFVSRRDLIQYAKSHPDQIQLGALQYLTTFSREWSAPTFQPKTDRPKVQPIEGNRFTRGQDDKFNPGFADLTGTDGKALVKRRFPLDRISLLAGGMGTANDILNYFGLKRNSANAWTYDHGEPGRILSLAEVAAKNREPDFFELLQAAVSVGSLGKGCRNPNVYNVDENSTDCVAGYDKSPYYQILQIGANIIDQYDADSMPTSIYFPGDPESKNVNGIENLPYLSGFYEVPVIATTVLGTRGLGMWYQPVVWNPHANAQASPSIPLRFISKGVASFTYDTTSGPYVNLLDSGGVEFPNSAAYAQPRIPSPSEEAKATGNNKATSENGIEFVGINMGLIDSSSLAPGRFALCHPQITPDYRGVTHELQYWNGSSWVTYSRIRNVTVPALAGIKDNYNNIFATYNPISRGIRSDPRTDRFGICITTGDDYRFGIYKNGDTIRPNQDSGINGSGLAAMKNGIGCTSVFLGMFSENTGSVSSYADSDGVLRPADGAYAGGSSPNGRPMWTGNFDSRPLVLNRPFRSVAELGFAFRDLPWKHLDFFAAKSGDAALLDVFCLRESPDPPVEAGKLNLNTRQVPVLKAALAGAMKAENIVITDVQADQLAKSLVDMTSDPAKGPLVNKSWLVANGDPVESAKKCWVSNLSYSSDADNQIKRRREAAVRALADIGNVRTWNLLVDVVAQAGRYPAGATDLNKFVVEGEKHYWVHLAIDRFTGEIIDRKVESVYE